MEEGSSSDSEAPERDPHVPALIIVYSPHEPARVGEACLFGLGDWTLGRGPGPTQGPRRARPEQQRPGKNVVGGAFQNPKLSRNQLQLHVDRLGDIRVNAIGRNRTLLNGWEVERTHVQPGDLLTLGRQLIFYCTRRLPSWPETVAPQSFGFGLPDNFDIVGESVALWVWRAAMAEGDERPLPPLDERREDIPLLLQHALSKRPRAERYRTATGAHRVAPELICALLQRDYGTEVDLYPHVDVLLDTCSDPIELGETPEYQFIPPEAAPEDETVDPATVSKELVVDAMERHGGLREPAWRDLGLRNRGQLDRLLKKHGLA